MSNLEGWSDIKWRPTMSQMLNVDETRKQQRFMAINGTLALTQRLCMTFVPITACQHQPF